MAKRPRSGGGLAAGVNADEEESETCKAPRQRRRCGTSSASGGNHFSRLDQDLVLEIAARLRSPSDACALAFASTDLYSVIRPALCRVAFLARYLLRGISGAPQCPSGFFVSTSTMTVRRHRSEPAAPDTMFVRGPRIILRGYNIVDPGTFRAFHATAKRRRAYIAASSSRLLLLLCARSTGARARYWVVDPASDVWIPLPPPPPGLEEDAADVGCAAFHCTAGMDLTVAYLARRRHSGRAPGCALVHLRVGPVALHAHGGARLPPASGRRGARRRHLPLDARPAGGGAAAGRWPQEHTPRAVLAWNTDHSWKVACPLVAVDENEEPEPLPRGITMLREADGLLHYCHTTRYPSHFHDQKLYDAYLGVWTMEAAAEDRPAAASAGKWQLRLLDDDDNADEGLDAEFWTWVLYNNIRAAAKCGHRADDLVAGHPYDVFRYSPDLTS